MNSVPTTQMMRPGAILGFNSAPTVLEGAFPWNDDDLEIRKGDVVQIVSVDPPDASDGWAKIQVAVLKGEACGRVGTLSVDLSPRKQRCWRYLTITGSMPKPAPRARAQRTVTAYCLIALDHLQAKRRRGA